MKIWVLCEKTSHISEKDANTQEYNLALQRMNRWAIPKWLTDEPVPDDFKVWYESLPREGMVTLDDIRNRDIWY